MLLHRKNDINEISSQVSFKLFVKLFLEQLFYRAPLRGVFLTQLKINNGTLLAKTVNVNYFRKKSSIEDVRLGTKYASAS